MTVFCYRLFFNNQPLLSEVYWLLILYSQFSVHRRKYALHLSHGEHSSKEGVAGVVSSVLVAKHRHAMVHPHWQPWVDALENPCQLYEVSASPEVSGLSEVAIVEDVA